ncbi:hypothetical protein ASD28_07095 [Massilia sp. Root133]|uniref:PEP-CTERM sorting domain-containing protein n=1 Tax=unclassified Massilia TaxID=2609279 RepID=UPI0006FBC14F|nr:MULTISPECIES: PEP-CTERM sorting domain-containing protein [unclassified Massilia]KQY05830.1 hypothetical protein ASD28_07095 [Massilia sp. Root133]KQZ52281.1 hypothetical protein ASD92_17210 [Massilia sp. Root1485]
MDDGSRRVVLMLGGKYTTKIPFCNDKGGTDQLNAVPEPVSIATFGLGAGAIAFIRRRRKQA